MKKSSFALLLVGVIAYVLATALSCRKSKECSTCKQDPVLKKDLQLSINNLNPVLIKEVPVWIKTKLAGLHYGDQRLDDKVFKAISAAVDKSETPEVLVLYLNKKLLEISTIGNADIKGISTFTIDKNMLKHNFYRTKNEFFEKDPYLSIHTNSLSMSALTDINSSLIPSVESSILLLDRRPVKDFVVSNKIDVLRKVVNHYQDIRRAAGPVMARGEQISLEDMILRLSFQYESETQSCGYWCVDEGRGTCTRDLKQLYPPHWYCFSASGGGGGCKATQLDDQVRQSNTVDDRTLAAAFNDSLHYGLRDGLLAKNERGKRYRNYYYYFSDVYIGETDLPLALRTVNVLGQLNLRLESLCSAESNGNEIFLNQELRNEIVAVINDYRAIYTDYYNDLLINDFIKDIDELMLNKSVRQVREIFQP